MRPAEALGEASRPTAQPERPTPPLSIGPHRVSGKGGCGGGSFIPYGKCDLEPISCEKSPVESARTMQKHSARIAVSGKLFDGGVQGMRHAR
jgi:hypothetical protein